MPQLTRASFVVPALMLTSWGGASGAGALWEADGTLISANLHGTRTFADHARISDTSEPLAIRGVSESAVIRVPSEPCEIRVPCRSASIRVSSESAATRVQPAAVREPGKIFISVDLEGITGVVQPAQLGPTGFEYSRAREWMTAEARAAIEGARAAGATSFVLADSHGNAQNLLIDQLPEDVRVVRGFPRPLSMMQGIDGTFAAAIFIGYHASEMTVDAVRAHTFSSARLLGVKLNGVEVSEGMFNAAIAGHFGVPVVFVSGDRPAVEQMRGAIPGITGAVVKEPLGYHSADTLTPARGQAMIRDGVRTALAQRIAREPYRVQTPIALEVGFKLTMDAERASYIPGLSRSDAHSVRGTFKDIVQVVRLMQVLTSLEPPA